MCRDGHQIGEFSREEFESRLRIGLIFPTDDYWVEGMTDWLPAREYVMPAAMARTVKIKTEENIVAQKVLPKTNGEATAPVREATSALFLAVIAPLFWKPLILLSAGLVIAAFVIGIMAIVRSRFLAGALLIAGCFFAMVMALAMVTTSWAELKREGEARQERTR